MKNFTLLLVGFLFISMCTNVSGQFTTTPDTTAMLNVPYTYDANANGATSYSLAKALNGMSIVPSTGVVTWTPTSLLAGGKVIIASNNGYEQEFFIHVANGYACLDGAISYWNFDETSGTTYKDSYGVHDALASSVAPIDVEGQVERAKSVPLSNSTGMEVANHPDFHFGSGESFSVSFWFKSLIEDRGNNEANTGVIVGRNEGPAGNHWWIGINKINEVCFLVRDEEYPYGFVYAFLLGTRLWNNLNWHHIVCVRDAPSNVLRIYFDGEIPAEASAVEPYPGSKDNFNMTTSVPLSIGYLKPVGEEGNYPMNGVLDEMVFYNRILSPAEVADLYDKGNNHETACEPDNYSPLFISDPDVETDEDQPYAHNVIVRDLDADALSFTVVDKPEWMQYIVATDTVKLSGTPSLPETEQVEIRVNDGTLNVTQQFDLEVISVNDPPIILDQIGSISSSAGATLALSLDMLDVEDEDNPAEDFVLVIKSGTDYTVDGNNITIDPDAENSIDVNVAVSDGTDESDVFQLQIALTVTGLDQISLENVETKFFPNPANDQIRFELVIQEMLNFELYDMSGNLVTTKLVDGRNGIYNLDVSSLPTGLYSFKFYNNKYLSTGIISISK